MQKIKHGSRYMENGWIRISVSGSPYERGYANGYLIADELKDVFKVLRFNFMNTSGLSLEFYSEVVSELYRTQIETNYPEYFEEMKGITAGVNARNVNLSLDDIIMWNCYYSIDYLMGSLPELINENDKLRPKYGDIFKDGAPTSGASEGGSIRDRCTAFIAVGDYTTNGQIVCAHNTFDNFIDAQYCNIIIDIHPPKNHGHSIIMQTPPGCISSGTDYYVNSIGIICTETTYGGFGKFKLLDPICCRSRKVMQYANSLQECAAILQENNGGDYANAWLFGDTRSNTIMRVELGLDYVNVEEKKNGYFIGYNAPIDSRIRCLECSNTGYADIRRHQGARRVRLTQLMKQHKGKIDIKVGQDILGDHYDVYLQKVNPCSRTCCSHYELDERAFMSQADRPKPYEPRGAIDGIVCDTTLGRKMGLSARWGSSCGMAFDAKAFCERNLQWADQEPYLMDRPSQPWTVFTAKSNKRVTKRRNQKKALT